MDTLGCGGRNNFIAGATIQEGFINYGTVFLVVLGLSVISWRQKHYEIVFDEDEQTGLQRAHQVKEHPLEVMKRLCSLIRKDG